MVGLFELFWIKANEPGPDLAASAEPLADFRKPNSEKDKNMRKTRTTIIVALAASSFFAPGLGGEGLLGHRYFGVEAGWERLENGASDDGWGIGAEWNAPIMVPLLTSDFGMDLVVRGETVDVFDRTIWETEGVIRGYMRQEGGFLPFGGVGFGWLDLDETDSTYLPLVGGVEFGLGSISVMPFARYAFTFDDMVGDFWSVGAKGAFWFDPETWGLTALIEYTSYDDRDSPGSFDSGIGARIGVIFAY